MNVNVFLNKDKKIHRIKFLTLPIALFNTCKNLILILFLHRCSLTLKNWKIDIDIEKLEVLTSRAPSSSNVRRRIFLTRGPQKTSGQYVCFPISSRIIFSAATFNVFLLNVLICRGCRSIRCTNRRYINNRSERVIQRSIKSSNLTSFNQFSSQIYQSRSLTIN